MDPYLSNTEVANLSTRLIEAAKLTGPYGATQRFKLQHEMFEFLPKMIRERALMRKILWAVVRNLRHLLPDPTQPHELWTKVAYVCSLGSQSAKHLCLEFDVDPDELTLTPDPMNLDSLPILSDEAAASLKAMPGDLVARLWLEVENEARELERLRTWQRTICQLLSPEGDQVKPQDAHDVVNCLRDTLNTMEEENAKLRLAASWANYD